ncbi:hypothetical protein RBA41_08830 [Massilia sp. CCM 9210]|uniref:hypothetical protein n=1 Tax=Massilia scottii TaxID=3057166 RepID=UPI002796D7E5|nr:hypothetical protein [Massilia sp. CCM 9210]MDQ1813406.1 hypothetical protein [Massilia sp. CCM 9210]
MRAALLTMLLAAAGAQAATETRALAEAELKSFHAYYQKRFPDNHSAPPAFAVTRASVTAPWQVAATVRTAPRRGLKLLCRMQRIDFAYAPEKGEWSGGERARQFVWLDRASGCAVPARPVELLQRMPDTELVGVLAQQGKLLDKARLLLAGNTGCARQRSAPFELHAIDVGATGEGSEDMVALVYRSARDGDATIWARRTGADYDAWNASCR